MWQAIGNTRMNQWASGALLDRGRPRRLGATARCSPSPGNFSNNNRYNATTANDLDNTTWARDYTFKYKGFASVGEYADRKSNARRPGAGVRRQGLPGPGLVRLEGPRWVPGASFWEIAFRYAKIDPTDLVDDNDRKEIGGAFSYYYNRHNLKVQADYRQLEDDAGQLRARAPRTRSSASRRSSFSSEPGGRPRTPRPLVELTRAACQPWLTSGASRAEARPIGASSN